MARCFVKCLVSLSVDPESVGVLLSPLGELSCRGVCVPSVAWLVVFVVMTWERVPMLEIG